MPKLTSYLRPFRYDRVHRIAVVETGPGHLISGVLEELRRLFPAGRVELLLREEDAPMGSGLRADRIHVVRFEERRELVSELRMQPFDLVVMQLSRGGSLGLRSLPFLLRGHALMAFNDSLDHFPVNVFRLRDLALHFGLASQGADILLAGPLFLVLLASAAWIHVRGAWRRLRRSRRTADTAPREIGSAIRDVDARTRARAAAGSERA